MTALIIVGLAFIAVAAARVTFRRDRVAELLARHDKAEAALRANHRWHDEQFAPRLKADAHIPVHNGYPAIAERLYDGDQPHCRRCLIGRDDRYLPVVIPCADHKPAGKHHATAPVYGPEPVVAEPDYDEWVDEWNRRYAQ